jgi:hypothetical protein
MAGVNLYIYAFANPIRYSDPNGRQPEDDEPAVLGPKPIGLLSMDYWSPGTCGGYYRCVTDHAIDAPLKKSRAEDKQAEQRAHNARKQAMREQKLEHLANQTSVLNRHHWSDHEKDVYRYEHFKETGIDVGRAPGRVNIEGAPGPENIVLGHIGMFLLGAAAGPSAAAEETLAVEGEVTAETVLADEGAGALEEVAANEATGEGADALGRGLANEAAPLAEEESTTVTVQRFCDVTNPQTMMSEAATTSEATAAQGARILSDPTKLELAGELHAQGMLPIESPFVSVLENPTQGIMAGEPTLTTIATGAPGVAGVESAPFLATFEVPANLLYAPTWSISQLESELLFFGEDLSKYLVSAIPNPFLP